MKKLVLKKWVEVVVMIVMGLAFMIMTSDVKDITLFMISHLGAVIVFISCLAIIGKYGRD